MPNVNLGHDELQLITQALTSAIASASRAQKSGKSPQIIEIYKLHEAHLKELDIKITKALAQKA